MTRDPADSPDRNDEPERAQGDAGTRVDRIARAICAESCAYRGEPACWALTDDETGEPLPWPNPACDEPGCHALALAAYLAPEARDDE